MLHHSTTQDGKQCLKDVIAASVRGNDADMTSVAGTQYENVMFFFCFVFFFGSKYHRLRHPDFFRVHHNQQWVGYVEKCRL